MGIDCGQYGPVGNPPVVGGDPAFSPDGTKITFDRNRNIFVMNSDGTNLQQITSTGLDSDAPWSPDGTKIAFTSKRTGVSQIFTMNSDGTNPTNISNAGTFNDSLPSWSPDGTKIAFCRALPGTQQQNIWTMNADGTGQVAITRSEERRVGKE